MKTTDFLSQIQKETIVSAIREAEKKTSGEIRVFITRKAVADPVSAGQTQFVRMAMQNTRERNGILFFVAPKTHKFAVIGDRAVHERCGDPFWTSLAAEMSDHFRKSDFTTGLVHGISKAGALLGEHFPHRPDDTNELSDDVDCD